MDHFRYRSGRLHAEEVPVAAIAAAVGTPFYVYSSATLARHLEVFQDGLRGLDHLVCYAVKANSNVAVLRLLGGLGAGMDVVSGGEYARVRAAGVSGDRVVFSGVGKTGEEMRTALENGVRQFNVESEPELRLLSSVAQSVGRAAPIAIRVNPDVDPGTHEKISTGRSDNKFGVPLERVRDVYAEAAHLPGIEVVGIDVHIGSQIAELAPYERVFALLCELTGVLRGDGHDIRRLDVGGGLAIPYDSAREPPPAPAEYCALLRRSLGHLDVEIDVEPGRLIAGNAGLLIAAVLYRKSGADREFLVLDSAMNDLLRPAMYSAHHEIVPVVEPTAHAARSPVDIVGPVCETGDTFARQRTMPPLAPGDLVAFRSAGAYGAVMSSEYNTRPLVPEVLVSGDRFAVIRRRPELAEIINRDIVPSWLGEP